MTAELLTMLNANGIRVNHIPGGTPEITEADVLFAMAGAPVGMWRLALVKICGRGEETRNMYYALSVEAAGNKAIRKWVWNNKGYLESLCLLAIHEINETRHCTVCNGTGARNIKKSKLVKCSFCKGTGHKGLSTRNRIKQIGLTAKQWKRCKYVYGLILNILLNWEGGIRRRLKRKLM